MEISYRDKKLKKTFENFSLLLRKYGDRQARKIIQRIQEFEAALNLYDIYLNPMANLHQLKGNRKGQLAVDVINPFRLVFIPFITGEISGYPNYLKSVYAIEIIEIVNYHKG